MTKQNKQAKKNFLGLNRPTALSLKHRFDQKSSNSEVYSSYGFQKSIRPPSSNSSNIEKPSLPSNTSSSSSSLSTSFAGKSELEKQKTFFKQLDLMKQTLEAQLEMVMELRTAGIPFEIPPNFLTAFTLPKATAAVFIDAESISPIHIKSVLNHLQSLGANIVAKRVYGNWKRKCSYRVVGRSQEIEWIRTARKNNISVIQDISGTPRKSTSELCMMADIEDYCINLNEIEPKTNTVLYQKEPIRVIVLVTSNNGFLPTITAIRNIRDLVIVGYGGKKLDPSYVESFDHFFDISRINFSSPASIFDSRQARLEDAKLRANLAIDSGQGVSEEGKNKANQAIHLKQEKLEENWTSANQAIHLKQEQLEENGTSANQAIHVKQEKLEENGTSTNLETDSRPATVEELSPSTSLNPDKLLFKHGSEQTTAPVEPRPITVEDDYVPIFPAPPTYQDTLLWSDKKTEKAKRVLIHMMNRKKKKYNGWVQFGQFLEKLSVSHPDLRKRTKQVLRILGSMPDIFLLGKKHNVNVKLRSVPQRLVP